jgi:hypothetical protein
MANVVPPKYKEFLLAGLLTGTVKCVLVDLADYTYAAGHDFIDDVPVAARVATATLTGKTVTNGVFDAADATFPAVTGDQFEALIFYIDTGTESTSRIFLYLDGGITNLPLTPNGGDIVAAWNGSGIFQL